MKNNYFIASKDYTEEMEYIFPISETKNEIVPISDILNDEFEILSEEDEEIDIDSIEEMRNPKNWTACDIDIMNLVINVNRLTKAVKQLNKKIKE